MQKKFVSIACSVIAMSNAVLATEAYMAPLAEQSLLADIQKINETTLVAVGERGHILINTNNQGWQQQPVPTNQMLNAVDFVDDQHGWAVGHDAIILATDDGGLHWTVQQNLPDLEKPLMDVHFFDAQHGIAVGAYGLFYRTQDGGQSWVKELHGEVLLEDDQAYLQELRDEDEQLYLQELASVLPHFNRLSAGREGRLYMAGEMGLLAFSDDQGRNWQRIDVHYNGSFFDVMQVPNGEVIAAGLRGNIFQLTDGVWQRIDNPTKSSINSIVAVDADTTVFVGNNGRILTLTQGKLSTFQTEDGKAIINALASPNGLIAVTESGIKQLPLNK